MKRKLFTLLLAMGLLTAFQTNAQLKVRFLADTSGLAKTTSHANDSFPNEKKAGLFNWLSFDKDKLILKTSTARDSMMAMNNYSRDSIQVQKDRLKDENSVFDVTFSGTDSTSFQITPKGGTEVELPYSKGKTKLFRILKSPVPDQTDKKATLANLFRSPFTDDVAGQAGYLAYVPDSSKTELDTLHVSVGLAGWDKKKEELSIKYFNEFAFYADTLPLLAQSFQFASEEPGFKAGRLYRTDSFPYFQIYHDGDTLIKAGRYYNETGWLPVANPTNWGHREGHEANLNDSVVYSWLDLKLEGNEVLLPGYTKDGKSDSIVNVPLDTLFDVAKCYNTENSPLKLIMKTLDKDKLDEIKDWNYKDASESDSVIYLKKEGDRLAFTVKFKDSKWTAGEPTAFKYREKDVYYAVDTTFMALLDSVYRGRFKHDEEAAKRIGLPYDSVGARYVYKYDDSWRPLYVKADSVNTQEEKARKYEYVTAKMLKEKKLLESIKPKVVMTDRTGDVVKYISSQPKDKEVISLTDRDEGVKFMISLVDTIRNATEKWFASSNFDGKKYTNKNKTFEIEDSVEVFEIKNTEGHLLTVLDTTYRTFDAPLKNLLVWQDSIKDKDDEDDRRESVRQLFAIVRDCNDDTYTFLPVAARYWNDEDTKGDTLSFNLAIGRENKDGAMVSLEGLWRLESSLTHKLVVADSLSKAEPLKFRLESPFQVVKELPDNFTIRKTVGGKYYRGDGSTTAYTEQVKPNDIGAQWTAKSSVSGEEITWTFRPTFEKGDLEKGLLEFAKKEVTAVKVFSKDGEDNMYYLEWGEDQKDIVLIEQGYGPEAFDLYSAQTAFEWSNNQAKVTIKSGENYLSSNDSAVSYIPVEKAITIHQGYTDPDIIGSPYSAPRYYYFSYESDSKDRYYLKEGKDGKIEWEKTENPGDSHKFYLPKGYDESKVYLHSKQGHLLQVSKDGSRLSFAHTENIYKTINAINDATADEPATLQWTIAEKATDEDWFEVDADLLLVDGVLAVSGANETFVGVDAGKGILSDRKDKTVVLKLEKVGDQPAPQSTVAYSSSVDRVDYRIRHKDSDHCLTYDPAQSVVFSPVVEGEPKQRFAFITEGNGKFSIVVADNADVFLSSTGLVLKFTENKDDRLTFTWEKAEDHGITGIKVIGASQAKVYGVAGGVKIANASGAVAVYTVDGRLVTTQAVTSPDQTVAVPAGIYIVKNGANVVKVVVK